MTNNNGSGIHSRALLVWLTISTWSARKYDRKISIETNARYNASSDAGRYNKMLLPGDAKSYKALVSLAGSIRAAHYGQTLAWSDEGWRLLPVDNYMQYQTWYRQSSQALDCCLQDFLRDYPQLRSDAQRSLNGLWRAEDYPSVDDMRKRFAMNAEFSPIPDSGDIRVDLASDQISAIETSINNRVEHATKIAVQDAWSRLHDVVAHIADRLSDPEAIFRDSLIDNAREVCDVLKRLNVTNDPDLESMRRRVERELTVNDPDVLRDTKRVRAATADRAVEIMNAMSAFYQPNAE
jgi:hypothetical protein